MGARERRKGKRGELEVVGLMRLAGLKATRGAPLQAAARNGGAGEFRLPDVVIPGSPFWVEVKRGKRVNVRRAMAQALEDANTETDIPVVIHRDDGEAWMVTARLEDIIDLAAEMLERTEVVR